ncbi:FUSC family protein [Actinomadura formosensis]|uniref:FUSC family protein n=1 Tax=Actinomadura formosensis TaxID=60706 RepID=UPI0008304C88|nr:FUSC family protein [Actinomadura formosensis]
MGAVHAGLRVPVRDPRRSAAGEAIGGLARRLRLLARALSQTRPVPAEEPPAAGGPVRRPQAAQRTTGERANGRNDLLGAAVIGQITRSIDRIDSILESARRTLGGGLRLAPAVHWKRPRGAPGTVAAAIVQAARARSPQFRHAARVAVLVTLAMAISTGLRLAHGQWMAVTVLVSLRDTYGQTMARVGQRIIGSVLGSVIAAVVLALAPAPPHAVLLMMVFAMVGFTLRPVSYAFWMVCATPPLMMLMDLTFVSHWSVALERIGLIAGGGLIAAVGARVLCPGEQRSSCPQGRPDCCRRPRI